MKDPDRNYH